MEDVEIPELIYPCWAYALRRIGKADLFSLHWVHEVVLTLETYNSTLVCKGDFVVWNTPSADIQKDKYPVWITPDGDVLSKYVRYDVHVAVYEGNNVVSDMSSFYGNCLPFIIRKYCLNEVPCKPDKMLRWAL